MFLHKKKSGGLNHRNPKMIVPIHWKHQWIGTTNELPEHFRAKLVLNGEITLYVQDHPISPPSSDD